MDYQTVKQYMDDEQGLLDLIDNYKPTFEKIEELSKHMREKHITSATQGEQLLQELNGVYGSLLPISNALETEAKNKEEREYQLIKTKAIAAGEKFVDAATKHAAANTAAEYKSVASWFGAYAEICKVQIGSCQSLLNSLRDEKYAASQHSQ